MGAIAGTFLACPAYCCGPSLPVACGVTVEGLYLGSVPGSLDSSEMAEARLLTGPLPTPSGAAWLDSGEPIPVDNSSAGSSVLKPHAGPSDVAPGPSHGCRPRGHSSVSGRNVVPSVDDLFLRRTRHIRNATPLQMRAATTSPIVIPTICLVEKPRSSAWDPAFGVDESNAGGSVIEEWLDVDTVASGRLEADTVIGELCDAELIVPDTEVEAACLDEANETKGV